MHNALTASFSIFIALLGLFTGRLLSQTTEPLTTSTTTGPVVTTHPPTPEKDASETAPTTAAGAGVGGEDLQVLNDTELRWDTWTAWSECTASCGGGGQQLRLKVCSQLDDANCTMMLETEDQEKVGYRVQWESCNLVPCQVAGGWGAWGNWSACSVTCGSGYASRRRLCDRPAPAYGGDPCPGEAAEHHFCDDLAVCPKEKKTESLVQKETFTKSDERPSAISIGSLGMGLLVAVLVLLVGLDMATLGHHCQLARRHLRKACRRHRGGRRGDGSRVGATPPPPSEVTAVTPLSDKD